jgi:hypothetical protein
MIRIFLYALLAQDLEHPRPGTAARSRSGAPSSSGSAPTVVRAVALVGVSPGWAWGRAWGWPSSSRRPSATRASGSAGTTSRSRPTASGRSSRPPPCNWDAIAGARGIWLRSSGDPRELPVPPARSGHYYYVALGLLAAVFYLTAAIERSPPRLLLRGDREDPTRPRASRPPDALQDRRDAASAHSRALGGPSTPSTSCSSTGIRVPDVALHPDLPRRGAGRRGTTWGAGVGAARARRAVRDDPHLARRHGKAISLMI